MKTTKILRVITSAFVLADRCSGVKMSKTLLNIFLVGALIGSGGVAHGSAVPGGTGPTDYGSDFKSWLSNNGYSHLTSKSFSDQYAPGWGGTDSAPSISRHPVIFVHGNGADASYWDEARLDFKANGWRDDELYAISWSRVYEYDDDPSVANWFWNVWDTTDLAYNNHQTGLNRVRDFIDAVLAYTGADKVDLVTHSLGVTVTRGAIRGRGYSLYSCDWLALAWNGGLYHWCGYRDGADYFTDYITASHQGDIYGKIDTFVGIAGGYFGQREYYGNFQTDGCTYAYGAPTCSFWRGLFRNSLNDMANVLRWMNACYDEEYCNDMAPLGPYWYSMIGSEDGVVTAPLETAKLPEGHSNCWMDGDHHLSVVSNNYGLIQSMVLNHDDQGCTQF